MTNAKDAYYHYLRFGIAANLQAKTRAGEDLSAGEVSQPVVGQEPAVEAQPANTQTTIPSENTTQPANGNSGSNDSNWAWDGKYSKDTTGSDTGWDTGNGWSATGVAALRRQQLQMGPESTADTITGIKLHFRDRDRNSRLSKGDFFIFANVEEQDLVTRSGTVRLAHQKQGLRMSDLLSGVTSDRRSLNYASAESYSDLTVNVKRVSGTHYQIAPNGLDRLYLSLVDNNSIDVALTTGPHLTL